jgi:tmRNA-binding protein
MKPAITFLFFLKTKNKNSYVLIPIQRFLKAEYNKIKLAVLKFKKMMR